MGKQVGRALHGGFVRPLKSLIHLGEAVGYLAQGKDPTPALERSGRQLAAGTVEFYSGGLVNAGKFAEPTPRAAKEAAAEAGIRSEQQRIENQAAARAEAAELALRKRRFSTLLTAGRETASGERMIPTLGGATGRTLLGG